MQTPHHPQSFAAAPAADDAPSASASASPSPGNGPAPPSPTPSPSPGGPSRRGYLIAGIIALLGLLVGGGGLARGIDMVSDQVNAFQRVDVPGTAPLHLSTAGDFTIYYEPVWGAGGDGETLMVPPLTLGLEGPGGEPVTLSKYGGSFTYSAGRHQGAALATFRIDSPGTYTLSSEAPIERGAARLAVGEGLGGGFAQTLVPGLILFVALTTATVLVTVTAVRRRRARRRFGTAAAQA